MQNPLLININKIKDDIFKELFNKNIKKKDEKNIMNDICNKKISKMSAQDIIDQVLKLPENSKIVVTNLQKEYFQEVVGYALAEIKASTSRLLSG